MSGAWSASYALHANILKCIKVHWFCKNPVVRVFIQCPNCALGYNAYRRILSMMHWCCLSRSCDPTLAMPKTSPDHPWGLHLSARMSLLFLPYLWAPIFGGCTGNQAVEHWWNKHFSLPYLGCTPNWQHLGALRMQPDADGCGDRQRFFNAFLGADHLRWLDDFSRCPQCPGVMWLAELGRLWHGSCLKCTYWNVRNHGHE